MHPTFRQDLRQFLRTSIQDAKRSLLPFHNPQHKGSVQKASPYTTNLAQLATSPQHLATSARGRVHLRIPTIHSGLATFTQQPHRHSTCRAATTTQIPYSGKSNVLQKNSQLAAQLTKSIRAWHRQYNNHNTKEFVAQQLQQHDNYQPAHLNIQTLKHVQQQLPKGIIHCEDHCPDRLMLYCPALYNRAITNTFLDEQVFRTSEDSPLSHHYDVHSDVTAKLPDYQWAFPQWGCIPQAYILPKRRKSISERTPDCCVP